VDPEGYRRFVAAKAFELTPEEEEELLESIAQIERGEFISSGQLLERLRRFG
jgi:hypothetical protein